MNEDKAPPTRITAYEFAQNFLQQVFNIDPTSGHSSISKLADAFIAYSKRGDALQAERMQGLVAEVNAANQRISNMVATNLAFDRQLVEAHALIASLEAPIPMVLHCPACGVQHVDAPEPGTDWDNPPHKSHLCHGCGIIWRPASVATNGVESLPRGSADTWPSAPNEVKEADFCTRCRGAGHIEVERRRGESDYEPMDIDCPECKGTGEEAGWTDQGGTMQAVPIDCSRCKGSGKFGVASDEAKAEAIKEGKCVCSLQGHPVCQLPFVDSEDPMAGCINKTEEDGFICGHDSECHPGESNAK